MTLPHTAAAIERIRTADPLSFDRPDTVAWFLLALRATDSAANLIEAASNRLARFQSNDGSLLVDERAPSTHWPTTLAAFAWNGLQGQRGRAEATIRFLLDSTGKHWKAPRDNQGHDTAIVGWSWVDATHSWVIPTSLAMLAITKVGTSTALRKKAAERIASGTAMILDRQLADGGWNYGNTVVLRNTLKPLPEESAWALVALAGRVDRETIEASLAYVETARETIIAPITLSAAMLAWTAWDAPCDRESLCEFSLSSQERIGDYPLAMTAQLIAISQAPQLFLPLRMNAPHVEREKPISKALNQPEAVSPRERFDAFDRFQSAVDDEAPLNRRDA